METTNLISTPNINGNIGSCKTEVTSVVAQRLTFFKEQHTQIATNSCTGQVETFKSVDWNGNIWGILIGGSIFFFITIAILTRHENTY